MHEISDGAYYDKCWGSARAQKVYKQHEREEEDMCESVLTLGEAGDAR